MKSFWIDGLSNTIAMIAGQIGTTIIFNLISKSEDTTLMASLGLSMSYYFFIFVALKVSLYELTSLTISKAHGSKKYSLLTTYLMQGFTLQFIMFCWTSFMF